MQQPFTVTWPLYAAASTSEDGLSIIHLASGERCVPLFTDKDLLDRFKADNPSGEGFLQMNNHAQLRDFLNLFLKVVHWYAFDPSPTNANAARVDELYAWAALFAEEQ